MTVGVLMATPCINSLSMYQRTVNDDGDACEEFLP